MEVVAFLILGDTSWLVDVTFDPLVRSSVRPWLGAVLFERLCVIRVAVAGNFCGVLF